MATPESLVEALARGLVGALLAQHEPTAAAKPQRPKVAKVNDVEAAVRKYLDEKLAEAEPEPVQEDLFARPGVVDLGEEIYKRHLAEIEAANERAAERERQSAEMPPGFFDPNEPGAKVWTAPGPS